MDRILIILKKEKRPKGFICPCTGVKYRNIQTCLLVYAADSGERLQDHWSSGFAKNREKFVHFGRLFLPSGPVGYSLTHSLSGPLFSLRS